MKLLDNVIIYIEGYKVHAMKRFISSLLLILMAMSMVYGCSLKKEDVPQDEKNNEKSVYRYTHDPRDNPEAMKDILEDPNAVYGFSPDPESTRLGPFAEYDWTDPVFVAQAKEERIAYHNSMESMIDILYRMRDEGASTEEMARAISAERNRLRLEANSDDPEKLSKIKQSNLETYGQEEGPTAEQLFEKYGSWALVIQKAFSPNLGMDVICGLYDEYYSVYIELGLADAAEN